MAEFIFKSSMGIAVSYLLYFGFIRNSTRFKWIRVYFLVTVLAAFLIPYLSEVLKFSQQIHVAIPEEYLRRMLNDESLGVNGISAIKQDVSSWSFLNIVVITYALGVSLVLLRFIIGFIHLIYLCFKFGVQKIGDNRFVIVQHLSYPFSFLHLIFINRQTLLDSNSSAMLQHEKVHVSQWHFLDIIFIELAVAFQWFNPFAWLLRRSVKELHEYLADEEVVKSQKSPLEYQLLLFNQVCGTNLWQPVNGFGSSLTKKRIFMINNRKKTRWIAVSVALMATIFAIQIFSRISLAQDPPKNKKNQTSENISTRDSSKWVSPPPPPLPAPPPPPPPIPFPLFKGTTSFEKSVMAFGNYLANNVKLPESYSKSMDKKGVYVWISLDESGKVIGVKKGESPGGYPDDLKLNEDPSVLNELIRVIGSAPNFVVNQPYKGGQFLYGVEYSRGSWKVYPIDAIYENMIDNPALEMKPDANMNSIIKN